MGVGSNEGVGSSDRGGVKRRGRGQRMGYGPEQNSLDCGTDLEPGQFETFVSLEDI